MSGFDILFHQEIAPSSCFLLLFWVLYAFFLFITFFTTFSVLPTLYGQVLSSYYMRKTYRAILETDDNVGYDHPYKLFFHHASCLAKMYVFTKNSFSLSGVKVYDNIFLGARGGCISNDHALLHVERDLKSVPSIKWAELHWGGLWLISILTLLTQMVLTPIYSDSVYYGTMLSLGFLLVACSLVQLAAHNSAIFTTELSSGQLLRLDDGVQDFVNSYSKK